MRETLLPREENGIKNADIEQIKNTPSLMISTGYSANLVKNRFPVETKILDIGCGGGEFLEQLRKVGFSDLSAADIEQSNDLLKNGIDFQAVDFCYKELPWEKDTFDLITAWEVFEHLENPHFLIKELGRVLKPGGVIIISMPNVFHIISKLVFLKTGDFPRWNWKNNHITVYSKSIFNKIFLKNLHLEETKYFLPELAYGIFNKLKNMWKYLPENIWTAHFIIYILKKPLL
jgi:2-polyprenyl-3-methyl-5-hydroxy-6-metoxy-1,4-benzoquinol methylase